MKKIKNNYLFSNSKSEFRDYLYCFFYIICAGFLMSFVIMGFSYMSHKINEPATYSEKKICDSIGMTFISLYAEGYWKFNCIDGEGYTHEYIITKSDWYGRVENWLEIKQKYGG